MTPRHESHACEYYDLRHEDVHPIQVQAAANSADLVRIKGYSTRSVAKNVTVVYVVRKTLRCQRRENPAGPSPIRAGKVTRWGPPLPPSRDADGATTPR